MRLGQLAVGVEAQSLDVAETSSRTSGRTPRSATAEASDGDARPYLCAATRCFLAVDLTSSTFITFTASSLASFISHTARSAASPQLLRFLVALLLHFAADSPTS